LSNVGFRGASQYVFLMYDTGAGSGQDGDVALVSEYFGRLCRLWTHGVFILQVLWRWMRKSVGCLPLGLTRIVHKQRANKSSIYM
jgi:hypothetical protein